MIEAAYEGGLKADVAKKLVYQTAFGAGRVLADSQEDPDALVSRVASKGGTTEAALGVFRKKGFGKIVNEAIRAAARRSRELREGK
jgi:pyrroline-5-carboxylate reductase